MALVSPHLVQKHQRPLAIERGREILKGTMGSKLKRLPPDSQTIRQPLLPVALEVEWASAQLAARYRVSAKTISSKLREINYIETKLN
jgi:hypothetical protein